MDAAVANQCYTDELCALPDFTDGLSASTNGRKWREEIIFQHPMITFPDRSGNEIDYWVGFSIEDFDGNVYALSKFYTMNHTEKMVEVYEVVFDLEAMAYEYQIGFEPIKISLGSIARILCDDISLIPTEFKCVSDIPEDEIMPLVDIYNRLISKHPLQKNDPSGTRKYMRVKVCPVNIFTDDMSGNTTKKYNKVDNWSFVPAALCYKKRNQMENTFFICASNRLSATRMLPKIMNDLTELENGVEMMTPTGEIVNVCVPLQYITAYNARHSELASSPGANARKCCRKCLWDSQTPFSSTGDDWVAPARSNERIMAIYQEYLDSVNRDLVHSPTCIHNEKILEKQPEGYKLIGGESLLRLRSFDVMVDTPIEVLHTIMLGVGKNLVQSLLDCYLTLAEKNALQDHLFDYDLITFTRKLRTPLRWCGSYLGRDFKILLQQVPAALQTLISQGRITSTPGLEIVIKCLVEAGRLVSLVYMSNIMLYRKQYIDAISDQVNRFRSVVNQYETNAPVKQALRSKKSVFKISKMHILSHLAQDIDRFASALFFETEKGEQFNKSIREAIFRTNRQNLSRDVALGFARRYITRHVITGGTWLDDKNILRTAQQVVIDSPYFKKVTRDFPDNNSSDISIKVDSTGFFRLSGSTPATFIGKVLEVVDDGSVNVVRFDFLAQNFNNPNIPFLSVPSTTIKAIAPDSFCRNIEDTCQRDRFNNVLVERTTHTYNCQLSELQLEEVLDLSQSSGQYNVINPCKFGTLWWLKTHSVSLPPM